MRQVVGGESESNWLQDVAANHKEFIGSFQVVESIKYAESKKGYLLKVDLGDDIKGKIGEVPVFCFIWANSPAGKLIRDFLVESYRVFCDPGSFPTYPVFYVEFSTSKNPRVAIDDEPYEDEAVAYPTDELAPGQEIAPAIVKKSHPASVPSKKRSQS